MPPYTTNTLPAVFQLVEQVSKKLRGMQSSTLRATGLTPPQFYILTLLWERDGQPLKDLAEALGCSRAAITGIVDTLERKSFVSRTTNPADRRSLLVRLTGQGRAMHAKVPALESQFQNCCEGLAEDEIRQLSVLLTRLDRMLTG